MMGRRVRVRVRVRVSSGSMSGVFIVLEGPDGSGTTKHVELLSKRLEQEGHEVVRTHEPTDGEFGKKVRSLIKEGNGLSPEEIQKLFCDDRSEHVERVIQPALDARKIVVCDRYIPSTMIYGEASGVNPISLKRWNEGFPKPSLLFFTLPPFEVCLQRVGRRESQDMFEQEQFLRTVYERYEQYAKLHPEVILVDTSNGKKETADEVWEAVQKRLL